MALDGVHARRRPSGSRRGTRRRGRRRRARARKAFGWDPIRTGGGWGEPLRRHQPTCGPVWAACWLPLPRRAPSYSFSPFSFCLRETRGGRLLGGIAAGAALKLRWRRRLQAASFPPGAPPCAAAACSGFPSPPPPPPFCLHRRGAPSRRVAAPVLRPPSLLFPAALSLPRGTPARHHRRTGCPFRDRGGGGWVGHGRCRLRLRVLCDRWVGAGRAGRPPQGAVAPALL